MSKIASPDSGPTQPGPSDKFSDDVPELYDEFTIQYSNGDSKTYRLWFDPKTNKQRRERAAALEARKSHSLESATHSKKEQAHRRQKTRALGNRLRGEAQRSSEARRKDS